MALTHPRRLAGSISGMVVWAVWFVVVYALTGIGCDAGWQHRSVAGGNLLTLAMLASTVVALSLIGVCAWRGHTGWRASQNAVGASARERTRFTALMMLVLSLVAGIGTVMIAIPILMLSPCAV